MKKLLLLLSIAILTLASCSKDDDSSVPALVACGCTVTQSGPGGVIPIDVSNAEIQAEYPGVIGCGTRANQAEFKSDLFEEILSTQGQNIAAAWLLGVTVTFNDFYCN